MDILSAEKMARELMTSHRLDGWRFEFDSSERRFGCCFYGKKMITLSWKLVAANNPSQVRDTILHEIAHAIAGSKAGHGEEWKRVCIQIGACPRACYSTSVVARAVQHTNIEWNFSKGEV